MTLVAYAVILYNRCQHANATCQATCGNTMADEPALERSYVNCTMRGFCIYKEFRGRPVLHSQANLCSSLLSITQHISISGWQVDWSDYVRLEID